MEPCEANSINQFPCTHIKEFKILIPKSINNRQCQNEQFIRKT